MLVTLIGTLELVELRQQDPEVKAFASLVPNLRIGNAIVLGNSVALPLIEPSARVHLGPISRIRPISPRWTRAEAAKV